MEGKTWDFVNNSNEADIECVGDNVKHVKNYGMRLAKGSYLRYKGENDAFNGTNELTVEAWILFRSRGRFAKAYMNPLVSHHGEGSGWELRASPVEQEFMATYNGTHIAVRMAEQLSLYRWHHIVGYMKDRTLTLYVDGKASEPKEAPEGNTFSPYCERTFVIGSNNVWGEDRFFTGVVGRVRIAKCIVQPSNWLEVPLGLSTVCKGITTLEPTNHAQFVKDILPCIALYGCDAKLIGTLRCVCRAWKEAIDTTLSLEKVLRNKGSILPEDVPTWVAKATDPKKALKEIAVSEMIEATWEKPSAMPIGKYTYGGKPCGENAPNDGMFGTVFGGQSGIEYESNIDDIAYFNASESMMVEAWVKFSSDGTATQRYSECSASNFPILSKADEESGWELRGSPTRQEFVVYLGYYGYVAYSTRTLDLDKWHHIVGVFTGREMAVVVDGVVSRSVEDDVTKTTSLSHSTVPLIFGRSGVDDDCYFMGEIGSARIAHAVLPPCLWLRSPEEAAAGEASSSSSSSSWDLPIEHQVTPLFYSLEYKSEDEDPGYQWDSE